MDKLNILVAAGGTGGHLFPALAVVEQLEKIIPDFNAIFVGRSDKIEARVVPELGYEFYAIPISGFHGILSPKNFLLPMKIFSSILKTKKLLKKHTIDAVLCTGAYISYPAGVAAGQLGVPLVLMESNVYPGKAIRLLSDKADMIFTSFEESSKFFPLSQKNRIFYLGNPVRKDFFNNISPEFAREKFGLHPEKKTVLIFGGSLGARSINLATEKLMNDYRDSDIQFIWQTGKNYTPTSAVPESFRVLQFIDEMATAYAAADLVVSRSGATTVSELAVTGKPSILIPLPTAANNEQESNAIVFSERNAGILLQDSQTADYLKSAIDEMINDNPRLAEMSKAALSLAKPDAAIDSANKILQLFEK